MTQRMDAKWLAIIVSFALLGSSASSQDLDPRLSIFSRSQGFRFSTNWPEQFGAEELYDGDDVPRIPEPMVFDLVRPLGAVRGEAEINTLAVIPLNRNMGKPEWAPEVEFAVADGLAFEFELPFEEWSLKSYKTAAQITFGRGFDEKFIHGAQGILVYDKDSGNWTPTLLYLAGVQIDETWSALAMAGLRTELGGEDRVGRTQRLLNVSLFRHISDFTTLGIETNAAVDLSGVSEFRLMPQFHRELRDHVMLQAGSGCLFTREATIPEAAFRLIYSF
jgi:hypothetical protein